MKNMTIGTKLMTGTAALILLALVLSWSGLTSIGQLKAMLDDMADHTAKKQELAGSINALQADMLAQQRGVILLSFLKDKEESLQTRQKFQDKAAKLSKAVDTMRPLIVTEEGKRNLDDIKNLSAKWVQDFAEIAALCDAGKSQAAWDYSVVHTRPLFTELEKRAEALVAQQVTLMDKDQETAGAEYSRSRWIDIGLIVLSLLVGAIVIFVVRQINGALRKASAELSDGADQVTSAATQVSSSSQSLAQGASEQAASIEETSASSEEITSMTRKNAENSRNAAEVMTGVDRSVTEANHTLDQMVGSMNEINTSSGKISKIIKVIDEIAFQTNILALNAAVEAARAGEAGMGFAVVADEVRNLAQRSAQAAKDTAGLIEESIERSTEGSSKLEDVARAIRGITESAVKVKTLVDEVNVGSQEQARGMEQISKAITQMEQVTQKSAANAEESASASEELASQAETMKAVVNGLQAMVGGSDHASSVSAVRRPKPAQAKTTAARPAPRKEPARPPQPNWASDTSKADKDAFPLDEEFKEF